MNKRTKVDRVFVEVHKDYDYTVETSGGYFHLKEQNNKYILSEEDIIKLIGDACDTNFENEVQRMCGMVKYEDLKSKYIKQILNNE